jgi:hypothetical protein
MNTALGEEDLLFGKQTCKMFLSPPEHADQPCDPRNPVLNEYRGRFPGR